jgi:hypothetical protein
MRKAYLLLGMAACVSLLIAGDGLAFGWHHVCCYQTGHFAAGAPIMGGVTAAQGAPFMINTVGVTAAQGAPFMINTGGVTAAQSAPFFFVHSGAQAAPFTFSGAQFALPMVMTGGVAGGTTPNPGGATPAPAAPPAQPPAAPPFQPLTGVSGPSNVPGFGPIFETLISRIGTKLIDRFLPDTSAPSTSTDAKLNDIYKLLKAIAVKQGVEIPATSNFSAAPVSPAADRARAESRRLIASASATQVAWAAPATPAAKSVVVVKDNGKSANTRHILAEVAAKQAAWTTQPAVVVAADQ